MGATATLQMFPEPTYCLLLNLFRRKAPESIRRTHAMLIRFDNAELVELSNVMTKLHRSRIGGVARDRWYATSTKSQR